MKFTETDIKGLYHISPLVLSDTRGTFVKTFNKDVFLNAEFDDSFTESYYSVSNKNVIRGMHFQTPPHDHTKLVYVSRGAIMDVVLDIRKASATFGKSLTFELNEYNREMLLIPKGCAHGFLSLEDNTIMTYLQTTVYNADHDCGIKYDSFGLDWKISNPVISERDSRFAGFDEYVSEF